MAKKTAPLLPSADELLYQFGDRLRVARLRRRLPAKHVAERAGMSPMTLRSLERGGSGVTMGAYLAVMQVLGIEKDLDLLGRADPLGRELQDARLPAQSKSALSAAVHRPYSATPAVEKLRRQPEDSALTQMQHVLDSGSVAQLHRMIESSPQAQLRKLFESLPSEQLRKTVESLPPKQMRKALKALPAGQKREILEQIEEPARQNETFSKPVNDTRAWIKKSGFTSSQTLANLIDPIASVRKKKGG